MACFAARTEQARIAASGPLRPEWGGRSRRQRGSYRHPAPRLGRARWESHTWPCAARGGRDRIECAHFAEIPKTFLARLARILPAQLRLLGPSDVLVFWRNEYLGHGGASCGLRSWQRVPWEVISAGGWPRLDMM